MSDGYGSGSGYGDGYGDGYGYGYGYGYGSGYGSGYGYGDGSGYGYGYGDGSTIREVGGYPILLFQPFPVVGVSCQLHTLTEWREKWQSIAADNGVYITEEEALAIIAECEQRLAS